MAPAIVQAVAGGSAWSKPTTAGNLLIAVAERPGDLPSDYTVVPGTGSNCGIGYAIAAGNDAWPAASAGASSALEISGQSSAPINASGNASATSSVADCLALSAWCNASNPLSAQSPWTQEGAVTAPVMASLALGASGTEASGAWSGSNTAYEGYVIIAPASAPSGNTVAITAGAGAVRCSGAVQATLASAASAAIRAAASDASVRATQQAAVSVRAPAAHSALTVSAVTHADTVGITARLAPIAAHATAYARNTVAAATSVSPFSRIAYSATQGLSVASRGSFSASFTVTQTNKPPVTVSITARVGGIRVALVEHAMAHAVASSATAKPASALAYTSAARVHAVTAMQPHVATTYASRTANAVKALLRPVVAFLRVFPPLAALPADPRYYIALPFRAWLVQIAARTFYAAGDTMQAFPTKNPAESFVLTFDATPDLASGETLASITETVVTLAYGTDPDPSDILATPIINAASVTIPDTSITVAPNCGVQVVASGGFPSTGYQIAITCTTSNPDKILTLTGMLPVGIG